MDQLKTTAKDKIVLIECMADHCPISQGFANVICDLCDEYPEVVFFQINKMDRYNGHKMFECLNVGKFKDKFEKPRTPTYLFFRNGEQIDEVVGANQPELQRLCKKYLDPDAAAALAIEDGDADEPPAEEDDDAQE